MKKIGLIVASILVLSTLVSCASNSVDAGRSATKMAKDLGAPDWYFRDIRDDTGIYAVGRAKVGNIRTSEEAAKVNGRGALAQMLQSAVNYIGQTTTKVDSSVAEAFKSQSTVIANEILIGSMQVDRFDMDGEVSVLMYLPYDDLIKNFKNNAAKQDNDQLKLFMQELTAEEFKTALENTVIRD